MIPFEELDRALARWKSRAQGGVVEARAATVPSDVVDVMDATPLPVLPDEELGSIPVPALPATGEIDAAELETYEETESGRLKN